MVPLGQEPRAQQSLKDGSTCIWCKNRCCPYESSPPSTSCPPSPIDHPPVHLPPCQPPHLPYHLSVQHLEVSALCQPQRAWAFPHRPQHTCGVSTLPLWPTGSCPSDNSQPRQPSCLCSGHSLHGYTFPCPGGGLGGLEGQEESGKPKGISPCL